MMVQANEYILEDYFARVWKPLCALQTMIGSARVHIVNNAISPRLWYQKVYGCFSIVLCCIGTVYLNLNSASDEIDKEWKFNTILSYMQMSALLLLNSCPALVNNFFKIQSNNKLMISLQRIDQTLKITTNEDHYKNLYKINAIYITFLLIFHVAVDMCVAIYNLSNHGLYLAIPTAFILTAQDLEVAFFNGVIIYLVLRVRYMNSLLNRTIYITWQPLKQLETPKVICRILEAYRHVLIVYELIEITTAPFLLLLCLHMFCTELIGVEEFILHGNDMGVIMLLQWIMVATKIYNRILFTGICVTKLEQDIIKTRLACLRVINQTKNKETRRYAKNLFRLVIPTRPMTVFGMASISSLPLQMAALTATYAVVLLQLNF